MDRITILCCAKMSWRDKYKLLAIGKSKKPRCFVSINVGSVPFFYQANKNTWMITVRFDEWISNWNAALMIKGCRILLLVDSCATHPSLATLQNIRVEFLQPNRTSLIQPMIRESSKPQEFLQEGAGICDSCCY